MINATSANNTIILDSDSDEIFRLKEDTKWNENVNRIKLTSQCMAIQEIPRHGHSKIHKQCLSPSKANYTSWHGVHVSNESSGHLNSCNRKFGEHQRRIFRVAWGVTKSHSFLVFSSFQMSLKVHCPTNTDSDSQSQIIKKMYYNCFATLPKNMAKLSLLLCFHHQHASLDYTCLI